MNKIKLPSLVSDIRLFGKVDESMLAEFFRQQALVKPDKPIVFELSSSGGDADMGPAHRQEIRLWQEYGKREVFFFGKTFVFSAGVTIMAAVPRTHRFLSADCELLVHERKLKKDIHLEGALRGCMAILKDALAEIESGQRLEREGFAQLVQGTALTVEDVGNKVYEKDWYMTAQEAHRIGLVAGVL